MGDLASTEAQDLVIALERDASVVFGEPWTNSQGMELVPVGGLLVAKTETPSGAYLEYLTELGRPPRSGFGEHGPRLPGFRSSAMPRPPRSATGSRSANGPST